MSISAELGAEKLVDLPAGQVEYRERGSGRPVVFVHGLLTNGDLWRKVVPAVADAGYRCITPDWPFGGHRIPVPDADLTPAGVGDLMGEFLAALELNDAVIVGTDTGGGMTQMLMERHPQRIGGVVLTPSDSLEVFPPKMFGYLPLSVRIPGFVWLMAQALRIRALHHLPMLFGWLTKRGFPPHVMDSFLTPMRRDAAVRADFTRFVAPMHRRHLLAAAEHFAQFRRPVLLAWSIEDRIFPISLAHRLERLLPNARIEPIEDSYTFVAEDQPDLLARHIIEFAGAGAAA